MKLNILTHSLRIIVLGLLLCFFPSQGRCSEAVQEEGGIDVKEIVLGHLSDAYEWHICSVNGHHVSIPLPVIVQNHDGEWFFFSSSEFHKSGDNTFGAFFLNQEQNGKIYEKLPDGTVERPLDLSITKDVVQIWIVVVLMLCIFLSTAKW